MRILSAIDTYGPVGERLRVPREFNSVALNCHRFAFSNDQHVSTIYGWRYLHPSMPSSVTFTATSYSHEAACPVGSITRSQNEVTFNVLQTSGSLTTNNHYRLGLFTAVF